MSLIMTFMLEPAKLQMNWASASGTRIRRRAEADAPAGPPSAGRVMTEYGSTKPAPWSSAGDRHEVGARTLVKQRREDARRFEPRRATPIDRAVDGHRRSRLQVTDQTVILNWWICGHDNLHDQHGLAWERRSGKPLTCRLARTKHDGVWRSM